MTEYLANGNDNPLADAIRRAIKAKPDEKVQILRPKFERPDGRKPAHIPRKFEEVKALMSAPRWVREECCIGLWSGSDEWEHRLVPIEWIDVIPRTTPFLSVVNKVAFWNGDTDRRLGSAGIGYLFGNPESWRNYQISILETCPGHLIARRHKKKILEYFKNAIEDLRTIDLSQVVLGPLDV